MSGKRMTSGIFVWSIEQALLALIGFGIVTAWQSLATTVVATADFWVMLVMLISCVATLVVHTGIAFHATNEFISRTDDDATADGDLSYLHKPVAQAHCCVVVLLTGTYICMFLNSLYDLTWAAAFYPTAPGLVFATGSANIAFCFILFVVSVASAWACTAVGDSNTLFMYHPLFLIICVVYPLMHEIGQNGLMICSSQLTSTLTFMYANLTIASSFALHFLDVYEFDPAQVFPKFMHSVAGRQRPIFRVYSLLHGLLIIIPFIAYAASSQTISRTTIVCISLLALVATLIQSLDISALLPGNISVVRWDSTTHRDSIDNSDTAATSSDDPKVKPLVSNWYDARCGDTPQPMHKSVDAKQLRIDFMRISKHEKSVIRKRG
jgi:hypothetical protein